MLKLLKYEFRKCRTGLIIMLIVLLGFFLLTPIGVALKKPAMYYTSVILLAFYAFTAYCFVLIRGISAYSSELKDHTGYLLFMIPKSTTAMLFSKLLFTVVFAICMLGIAALATYFAAMSIMRSMGVATSNMGMVSFMLNMAGLNIKQIISLVAAVGSAVLSSIIVLVSAGYFAITVSATLIQSVKGRRWMGVGMFVLLITAIVLVTGEFGSQFNAHSLTSMSAIFPQILPSLIIDLLITLGFTFLSAFLLKRKVML